MNEFEQQANCFTILLLLLQVLIYMQIIFIFPQKSHKNFLLQPSVEYTRLFIGGHKMRQRTESKIQNIKIDVIKDAICWRRNFPLIWLYMVRVIKLPVIRPLQSMCIIIYSANYRLLFATGIKVI